MAVIFSQTKRYSALCYVNRFWIRIKSYLLIKTKAVEVMNHGPCDKNIIFVNWSSFLITKFHTAYWNSAPITGWPFKLLRSPVQLHHWYTFSINSCECYEPAKRKRLSRSGTFMAQWFRRWTLESATRVRSPHGPLHDCGTMNKENAIVGDALAL